MRARHTRCQRLSPPINFIKVLLPRSFTVDLLDVLADPRNEMILESAFDYLMEEIGGDELINIGAREIVSERLPHRIS